MTNGSEGTNQPNQPASGATPEERSGTGGGPQRFTPDILERGGVREGAPQALDSRLFLQLHVFTECREMDAAVEVVRASGLEAVLYANVNDPRGVGVLVISESPETFVGAAREMYLRKPFGSLTPLPELTMMGRTYASGHEPDLEDWLLWKARRHALNPDYPWAIWYPLRRIGAFNRLTRSEQGRIMGEHATIGRAYGEAGHAIDIRLECHGLDRNDNEFVLGILGSGLTPLSKLIKDMRVTRHTSEFMQTMGPFFVGRALYQSPLSERAMQPSY